MSRDRRAAWLPTLVLGTAAAILPPFDAPAAAQLPFQLPMGRDSGPERTGTGSIAGQVVVDGPDGRPLRRVVVLIASGDLRGSRSTTTDDAGRFGFAELPSGNYTLTAMRPGYVTAVYGAKQPGLSLGTPIAVFDDKPVAGIAIRMLPGAAITGVVRLPGGAPVERVLVRAVPAAGGSAAGVSALLAAGGAGATTDDRGVYRLYGLPPGRYVVQARPQSAAGGAWRRVTDEEIRWASQAVSARPAIGTPAGTTSAMAPPPDPAPALTMAPVYHPGTPDRAAAVPVTVGAGEERSGVDVTVVSVPIASVAGVVIGPDGAPMSGADVRLRRQDAGDDDMMAVMMQAFGVGGTVKSGPDGAFSIPGVVPGRYEVDVRGKPAGAKPAADDSGQGNLMTLVMSMMPGGNAGGATLWARETVDVSGVDLTGLALRLREGLVVAGRVAIEGASPPPPFAQVQVMLRPAAAGASMANAALAMISSLTARPGEDGTFAVRGVAPGPYQATVMLPGSMFGASLPGATWHLKSATIGGVDVSDRPFTLGADGISELVVTLTDTPTKLSGTLYDQAGRPSSAFPIVVFSADRERWTAGSRSVQPVRPASDGTFQLVGLPAGDYYVSAVTDLALDDLYDPAFLEVLVPGAIRLSLADAEQKVQDLKLAGGEPQIPAVVRPPGPP